jgi:hypothetical protein
MPLGKHNFGADDHTTTHLRPEMLCLNPGTLKEYPTCLQPLAAKSQSPFIERNPAGMAMWWLKTTKWWILTTLCVYASCGVPVVLG